MTYETARTPDEIRARRAGPAAWLAGLPAARSDEISGRPSSVAAAADFDQETATYGPMRPDPLIAPTVLPADLFASAVPPACLPPGSGPLAHERVATCQVSPDGLAVNVAYMAADRQSIRLVGLAYQVPPRRTLPRWMVVSSFESRSAGSVTMSRKGGATSGHVMSDQDFGTARESKASRRMTWARVDLTRYDFETRRVIRHWIETGECLDLVWSHPYPF